MHIWNGSEEKEKMASFNILQSLKGESLLGGSHILTQLGDLKSSLRYKTEGAFISFDDHFLFLQGKIEGIKRIALETNIPAKQANQYENELLSALEEILEDVQKWETKTIAFQGRLVRAKSDIDELAAAFESWYFLAAQDLLSRTEIKFPSTNIKSLATAEFNRLMDRSNISIDALVEAVKIELKRLDSKRKMARQKFEMGCKQVDAAWATRLPEGRGYGNVPAFGVLKSGVVENDYDDPEDEPEAPTATTEEPEVEPAAGPNTEDDRGAAIISDINEHVFWSGSGDEDMEAATISDINERGGQITEELEADIKDTLPVAPAEEHLTIDADGTVREATLAEVQPQNTPVVVIPEPMPDLSGMVVVDTERGIVKEVVILNKEAQPAPPVEEPKPTQRLSSVPASGDKKFNFDDFDDAPPSTFKWPKGTEVRDEDYDDEPAPPVEIKGNFRKGIVSGPLEVIGVTVGDNEVKDSTPGSTPSKQELPEVSGIPEENSLPTERKKFDFSFDDVDVEPAKPIPVASAPEVKPAPTTPPPTPRKATPVFDFDDDELS
jgi:hypothetical protein